MRFTCTLLALVLLAGCASVAQHSELTPNAVSHVPFVPPASFAEREPGGKIKHVVFIIQENRSFDNLFHGYPGADTVSQGKNSEGQTIKLQPIPLEESYEIDHSANGMFAACNGKKLGRDCKMNGFNNVNGSGGPPNRSYVYVPHDETAPYVALAHEFVVADRMFQSHLDESFVSHQYVIAAQADSAVNLPSNYWGCEGGGSDTVETLLKNRQYGPYIPACFDYQTLGDELDKAKLTWRFYASTIDADGGEWSGYQAVKHIYQNGNGPDWLKDVISPQTQFFTDIAAGKLANVTWITPTCETSDHVSCGGNLGPQWVSTLVNAVGESKFWDSSAVFVMWDDWGGLYDHVPPPYEDYDGLGFRVPLLMISPYAKKDKVTHTQYETGSVLRFIEDQYSLGQLSASDKRANDPANDPDAFDFSQKPRKYNAVPTLYTPQFFENRPYDGRPPDDDY
jgi:phospholipase C